VVHRLALPVTYVIGSGQATRSYLAERHGVLTQSPLTWYAHRQAWDMSPGFAEANDRFSRRIGPECLYCHTDPVTPEPFTQNVFREIPLGIGCERCHGPGEGHVVRWSGSEGDAAGPPGRPDPTIVNPARLDRDRSMAVCQQCHLAGVTIPSAGRRTYDFRPGEFLSENRTVFVPELQLVDPDWVGIDSHPIRLARSACFQASGSMTCLTCHLPHTPPERVEPAHYDEACLGCHVAEDIAAHPATSRGCSGCHMVSGGTSDVPHVRFTDHWIRARPGPPLDPALGRPAFDEPTPLTLVPVSALGSEAPPGEAADLAAAYLHFWETMHRVGAYLDRVVDLGERALRGDALHGEGRIALARALSERARLDQAEMHFRTAAEKAPDDPWPHLLFGAFLLERREDPVSALPHLDRAVGLQPRLVEARQKRAEALFDLGRRDDAVADLEALVSLDPLHHPRSWFNLGVLRMEVGRPAEALEAFQEAARLDPDLVEAHLLVGSAALERGDLDEAASAFRAALAAAPADPAVHGNLALLAMARDAPAEARRHLERVLELDPGNAGARELLGRLPDGR
jgi:tetratricopeptide (TPR) repeat protein